MDSTESDKIEMDRILYGTGVGLRDSNGEIKHIPLEDIYIMSNPNNQMQKDYNDAINFAVDKSEDCELFMNMWRDGEWDRLEDEFGYVVSNELRNPHLTHNTTVTVTYASGSTREFVASDELEEMINQGEMFSVTTMHSDMSREEEVAVSKMYGGNPIAALGHMLMMQRNATLLDEKEEEGEHKAIVLDVLGVCISFLKQEITSHQSGMTPEESDEVPPNKPGLKLVEKDERKCPATDAPCEHYTQPCDGELVYCTHPDNSDKEHEGNCTGFNCPLCTEGGGE